MGSKYKASEVPIPKFKWKVGDLTHQKVIQLFEQGAGFRELKTSTGAPHKVIKQILHHYLGQDLYASKTLQKKVSVARHNVLKARTSSGLEKVLVDQLLEIGIKPETNVWQEITIGGERVPREADLKVDLGGGRKAIVLCDGEAFHGPRHIFKDPLASMQDDRDTASSYHSLGYSVLRYSESEILTGWAIEHFKGVVSNMRETPILRIWFDEKSIT